MSDQIEIKDLDTGIVTDNALLIFQSDLDGKVYKAPKSELKGDKGDPGDQGVPGIGTPGPQGDPGINGISFIWKGGYSSLVTYQPNDVVVHNGSSYICILSSLGNIPTNTTYWSLMAIKGMDGMTNTFETISKNINAYPYILTYSGDLVEYITYTVPSGTIIKTFNRVGDLITSIVLSGDTPSGISLTKTFNYSGDLFLNASYS